MKSIFDFAARLHNDEDGASLVEYAVLLGVVVTCGVAVVYGVGAWSNARFDQATAPALPIPGT